MKKYWEKILVAFLVLALAAALLLALSEYLTFEVLKSNRSLLSNYVNTHYEVSLLAFGCCFVATSFLLPGALGLTVLSGFLFGTVPGGLYSCLFGTAGATLAFLVSRHLIGEHIQARYPKQLARFNREIERYGNNYLFVLRVLPVMPAFLINALSGVTRMSTARFAAVSFFGILPGALIYASAGRELAVIESPRDILSTGIVAAFSFLTVVALAPVVYAHAAERMGHDR